MYLWKIERDKVLVTADNPHELYLQLPQRDRGLCVLANLGSHVLREIFRYQNARDKKKDSLITQKKKR